MTSDLRFYLDENVGNEVAEGLRTRGVDVLTTPEAEKIGAEDTEQLAFALEEERVLVTQDRDFLRLDSQDVTRRNCLLETPKPEYQVHHSGITTYSSGYDARTDGKSR